MTNGGQGSGSGAAGLRRLTRVLDELVRIPGTRFRIGLDPLLGLLPGGGDVASALLSGYALIAAGRAGAPVSLLLRMAGNIGLDMLVGAVPVLGDLFDFGYKANRRNLDLLERYLGSPQAVSKSSRATVAVLLVVLLVLLAGVAVLAFLLVRWLVSAIR